MGGRNQEEVELTDYKPIAAAGAGAELFDEPSLFYLTNHSIIEEWYSLRDSVADCLHEWFRTIVFEALRTPAADRGLVVSEAKGPSGYHHLVLHPPDATMQHGKPVIGAGFAWSAEDLQLEAEAVSSCVRRSRTQTGKAASDAFRDAGGAGVRSRLGAEGRDTEAWPVWRWIKADGPHWWTKLDAYCDQIVGDVIELVDACREPLEAAWRVPIVGDSIEDDET